MADNNKGPLVSILIDNYNYEKFIEDAIESSLKQSYPNIEVIVVDDGSQDSSPQIIRRYKDKIIPIFKENGGQSSAFNAGYKASKGDIICLLDSDDTFLSTKVEEIVQIFEKYKDVEWCFHPLKYIDLNDGKKVTDYPPPPPDPLSVIDFRNEIIERAQIPIWGPATSGLCFRRSLLEEILPMPEAVIATDYYIRYVAVSLRKGFFLNKSLGELRLHGGNSWTFQKVNSAQKAKAFVLIAYWMQDDFPDLRKLSNKVLGWGIGLSWLAKSELNHENQLISKYLSSASISEKLEIYMRACYTYLKKRVRK